MNNIPVEVAKRSGENQSQGRERSQNRRRSLEMQHIDRGMNDYYLTKKMVYEDILRYIDSVRARISD